MCVLLKPRNTWAKRNTRFGQNTFHSLHLKEDQSSVLVKKSAKPQKAPSEQDQQQDNPDPVFYREVDMSDLPSLYAEEVQTLGTFLICLTPGKLCLGPLPLCRAWAMKKANRI